jgi:hypothetical protein
MDILLHTPFGPRSLSRHYEAAFKNAVELFLVTAYLTEWDSTLILNPSCRRFRIIVGSDFGITRKAACEKVMRWLPPNRKSQFLVADRISGFHPKALFWKDKNDHCFALIGSSNLTRAAFETNYEANAFARISALDYGRAKKWVSEIGSQSEVVSDDWLKLYKEATPKVTRKSGRSGKGIHNPAPLIDLKLPTPLGMGDRLRARRENLANYQGQRAPLEQLFRRCAKNQVSSEKFYRELPRSWGWDVGDRFQGAGWEIKGKHSDFQALSRSFVNILDAEDEDRDDVVSSEIDHLADEKIPTRGAFLSEMLCLRFPEAYPVLNEPVWEYLKDVKYQAPRKASEGNQFIFLAKALRSSLLQNPEHPAKNLAELDTVIWLAYGKKK